MTPKGIALFLCSRTGIMAKPWADAGYRCVCVDIQHKGERHEGNITYVEGNVIDYLPPRSEYVFAFAFPPCTHLANSGNRWKADKGLDALIEALPLVKRCRDILQWTGAPWGLENPVGSLSTYWRKPDYTFHPWNFGDPESKKTCLWTGGGFVMPEFKLTERPADCRESVWRMPPSADRGDLRSVTPKGFAEAVFRANRPKLTEAAA